MCGEWPWSRRGRGSQARSQSRGALVRAHRYFFGAMDELVRPEPDNEVVLRLSEVVALQVGGDRPGAALQLGPLIGVTCATHPILKLPARESAQWPAGTGALTRSPPAQTIAAVYERDQFTCRYCARWTIPTQILRLISAEFPEEFPFHPNWRRDVAPRAYWDISTSVDHVDAVALGGDVKDPQNLATACARCQYQKSSRPLEALGWRLTGPAPAGSWRRLVDSYADLWHATGRPDARHHQRWIRAFSRAIDGSAERV